MSINKFNPEGYPDPTVYEALTHIEREAKKKAFKPLVFICSPFAGKMQRNIQRARGYSRFAVQNNYIPIAPHLLFPQFIDDTDKSERSLGIFMGLVLMSKCNEVWVFGSRVSSGMATEIKKAKQRRLPIRYFNEQCEEVKTI